MDDSLHKMSKNTGFHWPVFSLIRTESDSVLIRENVGQWKPVFSHVLYCNCIIRFCDLIIELRNLKTKYDRRERQMTRMLLVVTFAFLLFLAWQCVTQCFWMLGHGKEVDNDKTKTWNMVDASFAFAKLGVVFNSSMNCLFYCFTSSMFRKEMRNMFREFIGRYIFLRMSIRIESSTYHSSQTQKEIIMANSNAWMLTAKSNIFHVNFWSVHLAEINMFQELRASL